MMTSDEKTLNPSLIQYINSDLFTLDNISSSVTLTIPDGISIDGSMEKWEIGGNY